MHRLSGMDASFFYMETPTHHMHVVGTLVVDPTGVEGGLGVDRIRRLIEARIHLMPMLRRRMVEVPLGLAHPVWIEDPDFTLDNHIHHIAAPPPGTMRELAEVVGDIAGQPLDRRRPLWEMWLVEGLDDGGMALVTKMHHATIDGITGADLMAHLLDLAPDAEDPPPPDRPWTPERVPSDAELIRDALLERATNPLAGLRTMSRAARSLVDTARTLLPVGERVRGVLPFSGPRTVLDRPVTASRTVAFGKARLEDLRAVKAAFGTTVNDVVLAATTEALRRYLVAHDDLPDRPLVAAVPVSVHGDTRHGASTNQVSNMFVRLPVQLDDPVEQLAAIRLETRDAKTVHRAMGADLIQDLAQITPPGVFNLAMRIYGDPRVSGSLPPVLNAVVSNVPGPPVPLYIAGAEVRGVYPFGPLIEGSGLNVTVLSNRGDMDVGVIACRDTVPDVWRIVEGFVEAVDVLRARAGAAPLPQN